jgi:Integral membrane protein CcmA involved in cell shape determination
MPTPSGALLSRGVSIKGSVKFLNELLIDGEVEGTIDSTGTLTIGEHARIRGEIRTKSVKVRGTVEGNIFVTERCELQASCTLRGDVEAPRLVVHENATFLGSGKGRDGELTPGLTFAPGLVIKVKSPLRANHSSGIGAAVSRDSAKFLRRSHDAVIHVYDAACNVIETHEHKGEFKEPGV